MSNNHQICSNQNCKNPVFKDLDKCALHCKKNKYSEDRHSGLLEEFYNLLKKYIISQKEDKTHTTIKGNNDDAKIYTIKKNNFLYKEIKFNYIHFPEVEKDFDYTSLINIFEKVSFVDCYFYNKKIDDDIELSKETRKVFFDTCVFFNDFSIYPFKGWTEDDTIFRNCTFKGKIIVKKSDKLNLINCDIFCGGTFSEDVIISGIDLNGRVFNQNKYLKDIYKIEINSNFIITNCNFEKKITLNNLKIKKILIKDSVFKEKLEIKCSEFESFEFKNSNVIKVFTGLESIFVRFQIKEAVFEDFVGFEKAKFGKQNSFQEEYISNFIYATFRSFSSFRDAKFYSGLDLSRINLKEQPNFFQTEISGNNTNRETFRIIKNSFDKNGNHIEANNYFIQEMKAYKRELKKGEDNRYSEKIVIYLNEWISSFGQSYWRPIRILILSIILYNLCFYLQKYYFVSEQSKFYWLVNFANQSSKNFLPFVNFLKEKQGMEFISLLFYIWFSVLIWQIVVAIKRHTIR